MLWFRVHLHDKHGHVNFFYLIRMEKQLLHVLVVDDDRPYSVVLKKSLTGCGHSVVLSYSAEEAFQQMQKEQFDILLLDYKMEGTSGINILQWM